MKRSARPWNPRGEVSYDLARAQVGDRVRMKRSGAEGSVSYVVPRDQKVGYGVRVRWDNGHEGRVVAAAFDLEKIS